MLPVRFTHTENDLMDIHKPKPVQDDGECPLLAQRGLGADLKGVPP
jgi:hypothetical protein